MREDEREKADVSHKQLSNYWTANMYFKARNGTFKRVPQVPNRSVSRLLHGICLFLLTVC